VTTLRCISSVNDSMCDDSQSSLSALCDTAASSTCIRLLRLRRTISSITTNNMTSVTNAAAPHAMPTINDICDAVGAVAMLSSTVVVVGSCVDDVDDAVVDLDVVVD